MFNKEKVTCPKCGKNGTLHYYGNKKSVSYLLYPYIYHGKAETCYLRKHEYAKVLTELMGKAQRRIEKVEKVEREAEKPEHE